jgi:TPP-dependent pyruvate/acetoin dehydrogenase alpha subunit
VLLETKTATEAELDGIDASIEERVDKSVELAESSPNPLPEDALQDVYWNSGDR